MAHLRRPHHTDLYFLLAFGIFDGEFSSFGNALRKNQHGTTGTHGVSMAFERIRLPDDLNYNMDPE
jgi:hypothetical protein